MSKSKPQTTTTINDTSTHIPVWLEDQAQNAVNRAYELSNREYSPYYGDYVAPQTNDTLMSYQQVRNLQGQAQSDFDASRSGYGSLVGQASPLTTGAVNQNTNSFFGNFQQGALNPAQGLLSPYMNGPATAQNVGANATALMSPYTQQVINPTLAAGEQAREIARQKIAGNANNVGAFGGSRQGVAEGVSDAQTLLGTQQQIGQMLQTGWGQALNPASQLALQAGQQGYGAAGLLSNLGAQGYANAATAGQGMANTNLQAGLTAAGALPNLAAAQQKYGQTDAALLQAIGTAEQNWTQQNINAAMGEHYQAQNWPVENLQMLLGAVGGVPYSTNSQARAEQTQKIQKNVAGAIISGAMQGGSMGASTGNPYAAAGGAVVGGLLGAFS